MDEWFSIIVSGRIPSKVRREFHSLSISNAPELMRRKGLKYIPAVISSTKPLHEEEVEGALKSSEVVELSKRFKMRVKRFRGEPGSAKLFQIQWSAELVGLEEVERELRLLESEPFSKQDESDRMIAEEDLRQTSLTEDLKLMTPEQRVDWNIDFLNKWFKHWAELFRKAYEIRERYKVEVWFVRSWV